MGNKGSTETTTAAAPLTPVQEREENIYEDYVTPALSSVSSRASASAPSPVVGGVSGTPPILTRPHTEHKRPHGIERRSMTVVGRGGGDQRRSDAALRRLSTSDAVFPPVVELPGKQDNLKAHIVDSSPQPGAEEVELATSFSITFDHDVLTVSPNKLFEVKCEVDATKPVEGHVTFDPRTKRAEFTPHHTLHPGTTYTVSLSGRAVTSSLCPSGGSVSNTQISFKTCTPPPKNIGVKLKGQKDIEKLQIANFYDLYNSLIVWSTKQWGCSGEHVVGMYVEGEERGRLQPLKADQDVLRLRDDDIVVVEIKD